MTPSPIPCPPAAHLGCIPLSTLHTIVRPAASKHIIPLTAVLQSAEGEKEGVDPGRKSCGKGGSAVWKEDGEWVREDLTTGERGEKGAPGRRKKVKPWDGGSNCPGEKKGLGDNIGQSRGVRGPGARSASTERDRWKEEPLLQRMDKVQVQAHLWKGATCTLGPQNHCVRHIHPLTCGPVGRSLINAPLKRINVNGIIGHINSRFSRRLSYFSTPFHQPSFWCVTLLLIQSEIKCHYTFFHLIWIEITNQILPVSFFVCLFFNRISIQWKSGSFVKATFFKL